MKRFVAFLMFSMFVILSRPGAAGASPIISGGATLRGGSGTNWSSDLGLDYHWPLHLDDPGDGASDRIGTGNTTPYTSWSHYFDAESVDNMSYYASPTYLSSSMRIDIGAAGDVQGKVHHIHIDNIVPQVGAYGLGAYSQVNTSFNLFDAGPHIGDALVYYAFDWAITSNVGLIPGVTMQYLIDIPADGSNRLGGNLAPQNLSGHSYGSMFVRGTKTSQFSFEVFNGAGGTNAGGLSTFDVRFAFSATPITAVPSGTIPEPFSLVQIGMGLAAAGALARHSKAKTGPR